MMRKIQGNGRLKLDKTMLRLLSSPSLSVVVGGEPSEGRNTDTDVQTLHATGCADTCDPTHGSKRGTCGMAVSCDPCRMPNGSV